MNREVVSAYCNVRLEILSHYVKGSPIRSWVAHTSAGNCLAGNRERHVKHIVANWT